jgi:hypothetical protein
MIRLRLLPALLAVVLTWGCAAAPAPPSPFTISREAFFERIRTVALTPMSLSGLGGDLVPIQAKFETLLATELCRVGLRVIPSREFLEIFTQAARNTGGFFDPVTGRRDIERYKAVMQMTLLILKERFQADAALIPMIEAKTVEFYRGEAEWDGTKEWFTSVGRKGSVNVLSVKVMVQDATSTELFVSRGGLQVAAKIVEDKLVHRPPNELFRDEERNAAAVRMAVAPLQQTPGTAPAGTCP